MTEPNSKVRLDKWLWAARFFKTRGLAKQAIEAGQIRYNQARTKPSQTVKLGAEVEVRKGPIRKVIVVRGLSDRRRGAPEAAELYEETAESVQRREEESLQRAAARELQGDGRPSKRDRRQLERFKRKVEDP